MERATTTPPLLEVSELTVSLTSVDGRVVHALRGVSLTLSRGEALALVGESGAGKSMCARALFDVLPAGASVTGRIVLDDVDLNALDARARRAKNGAALGLIFQEPLFALDPLFTIGAHLDETLATHRTLSRRERRAHAVVLLEQVGLVPAARFSSRYPHALSGGERQRALIAIALACDPLLVVADEPTTALDPTTEREVLDVIDARRHATGAALLLITHDLSLALERTTRIAVLYAGTIVEEGEARAIVAAPRHPYTRALVAAASRTRARDAAGEPLPLAVAPAGYDDDTRRDEGCAYRARCERASTRCALSPPLVARADGGRVACHHPLDDEPHDAPHEDRP